MNFEEPYGSSLRIGDLVKNTDENSQNLNVGVIIDFETIYDRYGDPQSRLVIVNWGPDYPEEDEYPEFLKVVNED